MTVFLFEVMDKEYPLSFIWIFFGALALFGFLLVRKHPAFLLLVALLWLLIAPLHISELADPYVGPDIVREAGSSYVWQSYIAITVAALMPALGLVAWLARRISPKAKVL